jgi:hypothetical protein
MPKIPTPIALSRRGKLIDELIRERHWPLAVLARRAHIRPLRMKALMEGHDALENELSRLAIQLQIEVRELVEP